MVAAEFVDREALQPRQGSDLKLLSARQAVADRQCAVAAVVGELVDLEPLELGELFAELEKKKKLGRRGDSSAMCSAFVV